MTIRAPETLQELRDRAQQLLGGSRPSSPPQSRDDLVQELSIHQIELEMQNEALRELHVDLLSSRERYHELFDGAPVPYAVLGAQAQLLEINRAGAELLDVPWEQLVGQRLSRFVWASHTERFVRHMRDVLQRDGVVRCELK